MLKNTASVTATTYTVDPALVSLDSPDRDALVKPYRWDTEEAARMAVRMFRGLAGMYKVTRHTAPGLEVFAIYREGRRSEGEPELVLMSVIEFSDDTAARLHKAVRREQPVTITYTRADGTGTVRTIEPFALKTNVTGAVRVASLDRESGEVRDFRIDRISAYTVHRTRRTVRTAAPAPTKAELWEAWTASQREFVPAAPERVQHTRHGYTGRTVPGTRAYGPSGWSVIVELDDPALAVSGTTRASESELTPATV